MSIRPSSSKKRVKLENALDAQFEKLMTTLPSCGKLASCATSYAGGRDAAGNSAVEGSHDDVDAESKSAHGAEEFDFAELDRGDVERSRRKNVRLRTAAGRQLSQGAPQSERRRSPSQVYGIDQFSRRRGDSELSPG